MSEDEDLFRQLVGEDVTPVKTEKRVDLSKKNVDAQSQAARRDAALNDHQPKEDPLAGEPKEMVKPLDLIAFQRPGVQHGVYRNLRLGKYNIDARLDLHKMTIERARRELFQFIKDCLSHDIRSALVTHGKGEGRETPALLKSYVAFWLPKISDVLAYHTAQKHHGGYGATYILLRKSDKKKQETRQQLLNR